MTKAEQWLKQEVKKLGYEVEKFKYCKTIDRLYFEIHFNNAILSFDFYGKYGGLIVETNNKIEDKFNLFGYSIIKTKKHILKKCEITMGAEVIKNLIQIAEEHQRKVGEDVL